MHYFVLASDYDGTLATHGQVNDETLAALKRLRISGRKLILVTGRELDELLCLFPQIDLFDCIVAENGALVYWPASRQEKLLGPKPPEEFVKVLRDRNVDRLSVGRVLVATWRPYETIVMEVIRELGLQLQVIFNKDAVMVLPEGINKASGLNAALNEMNIAPDNVVGVGDAENDYALLRCCGCGVAVANALPMLKECADLVTSGSRGAGVIELIDKLIASDLSEVDSRLK
jgi:HAD superfamily hydrolase (TIGR01484 family)